LKILYLLSKSVQFRSTESKVSAKSHKEIKYACIRDVVPTAVESYLKTNILY